MARQETYGTRDLSYSKWHRTLSDDCTYIDIDCLEYCDRCKCPLALVELAQDRGQERKATTVMRRLAHMANLPAFLVFYQIDPEPRFRVRQVYPHKAGEAVYSELEYRRQIERLHRNCKCKSRSRVRWWVEYLTKRNARADANP